MAEAGEKVGAPYLFLLQCHDPVLQDIDLGAQVGPVANDLAECLHRAILVPDGAQYAASPEPAAILPHVPAIVFRAAGIGSERHLLAIERQPSVFRGKEDP
ncbi:MAG: hypothetical protein ACLGHY_10465, partial [Gammaproteobacteria bacterium]